MSTPTSAVKVNPVTGALIDPIAATFASANGFLTSGSSDAKDSVVCATTANGTLATAFENGDTVDGIVLATGNRILIKNQSAQAQNGIYTVNASGAPTRATDFDAWTEIVGAFVSVESGTVNAGTQWLCNVVAGGTLGVTAITFVVPKNYVDLTTSQTIAGAKTFTNVVSINNVAFTDTSASIPAPTGCAVRFGTANQQILISSSGDFLVEAVAGLGLYGDGNYSLSGTAGNSYDIITSNDLGAGVATGILSRPVFATVSTAGTTTLDVTSASTQEVTGTNTRTFTMPVVTTLVAGWATTFINKSTGNVTLNSSGGNSIFVLAAGQSVTLVCKSISADTTAAAWDVVGLSPHTVVSPIGSMTLKDEFLGGTVTAGNYGNLGWTILPFGGAATAAFVAGTLPNVGVLSYTSGNASGNGGGIYFSNSSLSHFNNISGLVFEMWWTVKLTSVADVGVYLGFLNDTATGPKIDNAGSGCNNQGVWISFDTSLTTPDAQWKLRTCNASSGTGNVAEAAFTGSIVAGQYYTFKLQGDGTGVIYGTMYDNNGAIVGTEISVSGKTPTSTMVIAGVELTRTTAQKTISFDYFGLSAQLSR